MLNWNDYLAKIKSSVSHIRKLNPDVIKGYAAITNAKPENSVIDPKMKELISLAVAVSVRCDGCIAVHTELAKKHGASKEEIMEVLGIAIAVNAGAALIYSARTIDAFEKLGEPQSI